MPLRMVWILGLALVGTLVSACSNGPGEKFLNQGAVHIEEGAPFDAYNSVPPTSGPHWPVTSTTPASWGIYTTPIPNERQLHNLEHSGIMIQYNTEDQGLINQLIRFAQRQRNFPCFLVVAPYPDMPFTIALTAWGVRDTMDAYDDSRLQGFVNAYREKGPERVRCT